MHDRTTALSATTLRNACLLAHFVSFVSFFFSIFFSDYQPTLPDARGLFLSCFLVPLLNASCRILRDAEEMRSWFPSNASFGRINTVYFLRPIMINMGLIYRFNLKAFGNVSFRKNNILFICIVIQPQRGRIFKKIII